MTDDREYSGLGDWGKRHGVSRTNPFVGRRINVVSSQEFCPYCGVDTRMSHRDECPAPELDELRGRIDALERNMPLTHNHADDVFRPTDCDACHGSKKVTP